MHRYVRIMSTMLLMLIVGFGLSAEGVQEPTVAAEPADGSTITIVDEAGNEVEIGLPIDRIACFVPQVGEVLAILGKDDLVVARATDVVFPERYLEIPDVGKSNQENIELLLETEPDLVIGRARFLDQESKEKIEKATGAPVIQYRGTTLETTIRIVEDMSAMLGAQARAEQFISFVQEYMDLISERVEGIPEEEKTEVFFQSMGHMFWTGNKDSSGHGRIVEAGGINIAANEGAKVPRLSAEWVLERDPELIIHSYSGARKEQRAPTLEEMKAKHDEIASTPGLKEVEAVTENKAYVIDVRLITGPRSIVGKLYYAKWFNPSYFEDVDPKSVHRAFLEDYFGIPYEGIWVYPAH
jgi:iron complex transport system substrate-binding protein